MERVVRNFKLIEQIGTGGMGVIYRAIQLTLDRVVAFKEMHPHLSKDAEFIRRFEREAKTAATLQHENIVGVVDFGQEGETFFLALEFVDGFDLKYLLAKDPKVVLPVALTVMADVLRGLEHAHARGVVHRDIKPANVMMTRDGIAKIADFSIASAQAMPSMTVTGAMLGTPAYMSPEQAAGGRPVDARTDLFSAGVILYEMLGGSRPFDGDTYATIISKLLTVTPPDLSEIEPAVPESIARVVKRAIEKDPDRRYQSAADFRRDLENAAHDEKIPIDRALAADWVKAPKEFQEAMKRRQAQELYQRGLYLKNQGLSHIDDAIKALNAAKSLDPNIRDAQTHLDELLRNKADTLVVQRRSVLRKERRKAMLAGGAGIAGLALLAFFLSRFVAHSGTPAPAPTPAQTPIALASVPAPTPIAVLSPSPTATLAVAPTRTPRPVPTARTAVTHVAEIEPTSTPAPAPTTARAPSPVPAQTTDPTSAITVVDPEMRNEGFLKLAVKPWAKVFVDGKYIGDTPFARPLKISKGAHELSLINPQFPEHKETIEIPAGSMLTRQITLSGG